MNQINSLIQIASKAGFDSYGNFNEGEDGQHEILTCTKGKYSGEVVDIWYDYNTGITSKVEVSCQFPGQVAQFKFPA